MSPRKELDAESADEKFRARSWLLSEEVEQGILDAVWLKNLMERYHNARSSQRSMKIRFIAPVEEAMQLLKEVKIRYRDTGRKVRYRCMKMQVDRSDKKSDFFVDLIRVYVEVV